MIVNFFYSNPQKMTMFYQQDQRSPQNQVIFSQKSIFVKKILKNYKTNIFLTFSAADKIYATLRECREQADPKKQKGVQMQGYLLKKKEKLGRWKQLYFVLKQDGGDSHLYFYEVGFLFFLDLGNRYS